MPATAQAMTVVAPTRKKITGHTFWHFVSAGFLFLQHFEQHSKLQQQ